MDLKVNRVKQISSDAVIYGVGGLMARAVSFLVLPIYTSVFSPAEFGQIEMAVTISSLFSALAVAGQDAAQSFYFFKNKALGEASQREVVSSVLAIRLFLSGVLLLLAALVAPLVNVMFFDGAFGLSFFLAAVLAVAFNQFFLQANEIFRLTYKPVPYVTFCFAQSVVAAGTILLFAVFLDQGPLSWFAGGAIANFLVMVLAWYKNRKFAGARSYNHVLTKRLLRYGLPLVPVEFTMYFMSTADRWFVNAFKGPEQLGIYAIGAKLALLLTIVFETFRKAWWPVALDAMHSKDGPETFRLISNLYLLIGSAAIVSFIVSAEWVVSWIAADAYADSWRIASILSVQAFLYGYFLIASGGIWYSEKTYVNVYLMGFGAMLGLAMNYFLVPRFGGIGAAVATVMSYFVWIVGTILVSERYWKIGLSVSSVSLSLLVIAIFLVLRFSVSDVYEFLFLMGTAIIFILICLFRVVRISGLGVSRKSEM